MIPESAQTSDSITDYLKARRLLFEQELVQQLEPSRSGLERAMAYTLLLPSKRIRPLFCLEVCQSLLGRSEEAMPAAMALEFVHSYSLIHDDLPAMDDDELRRGQPTNHRVFGEARAILAGDALLTKAFEILAMCGQLADGLRVSLIKTLSSAAGDQGMVLGQDMDLDAKLKDIRELHLKKTGELLAASFVMGAISAGASQRMLEDFREIGLSLGLVFQIWDDVLDVEGGSQIGKPLGSDEKNQKRTFVRDMGLEAAKLEARKILNETILKLRSLELKFENRLEEMAYYILERRH